MMKTPRYNVSDDPHAWSCKWNCPIHGKQSVYVLIHKEKMDYCKPCQGFKPAEEEVIAKCFNCKSEFTKWMSDSETCPECDGKIIWHSKPADSENWQIKFDEKFKYRSSNGGINVLKEDIKSFISNLLKEQDGKAYNEGKQDGYRDEAVRCLEHTKQARQEERDNLREKISALKKEFDTVDHDQKYIEYCKNYNEVLDEVLSLLNPNKEKD